MKRYIILIAAFLMMLFIGFHLAWSTFVPVLKQNYGFSVAQTQTVFGTAIFVVTCFMFVGSKLETRIGPRITSFIGGIIYGASYILAGYSTGSYTSLLVLIGICSAIGSGLCYMSALPCVTKCFPQHRSLVIGIVVAGFGGSAIFVSRLGEYLLARQVDVLTIFQYLGICSLLIITTASLFLQNPPAEKNTMISKPHLKITAILRDRNFWGLLCGFFPGSCVGLMCIGNIKPFGLSLDLSLVVAGAAVTVVALFNTLGRIGWGLIGNLMAGKKVIILSLVSTSIVCLAAPVAITGGISFQIFAFFAGFNYASVMVLYAAEIAHTYGTERMGIIYSILMPFNGFAGFIAPPLAGKIFDTTGTYTPAFLILGSLSFAAIFLFYFIYQPERVRQ
ncbi:MAG: Oxalate:formate antiporter [Smithella sp. PtaU1.Bin162]|nr:MAG: Oxalate:formate antiporter [Smithella sp. PtaU1.Bin162]